MSFLRRFGFFLIFAAVMTVCPSALEAAGRERVRVAVMDFRDNSNAAAPARAIQDMLSGELAKIPAFSVVERMHLDSVAQEQRMSAQGLTEESTNVEMSHIKAAQYLIAGAITQYHYQASGGAVPVPVPFLGGVAVASEEAHVTLDVRLIDTTTSEVVATLRQTGVANQTQGGIATSYGGFGTGKAGGLLSQATFEAVTKIVYELQEKLLGDSGAYRVLSASTKEVMCNLGSANSSVKKGDRFVAYRRGEVIRDFDGTELGVEKNYLCMFQITSVDTGYSTGKIIKGCVPRRGALVSRAPSNWKELKYAADDYGDVGGFDIDAAMEEKRREMN